MVVLTVFINKSPMIIFGKAIRLQYRHHLQITKKKIIITKHLKDVGQVKYILVTER